MTQEENSGIEEKRFPVSIVILTKNEEARLADCLESCLWADDIVVVDSGSRDRTIEIAKKYRAYVIQQGWLGFGLQRRFAVSQAFHDWVLCIDADERLSPELAASIKKAVSESRSAGDSGHHVFAMPRRSMFMGRYLRHGSGYPDPQVRLFDRRHAEWDDAPVEETVKSAEKPVMLSGDLLHCPTKNLAAYIDKQINFAYLRAKYLHRNGVRFKPCKVVWSPFFRFIKYYFFKRGFLDGLPGFVQIACGCINSFVKHARLCEIELDKDGTEDGAQKPGKNSRA